MAHTLDQDEWRQDLVLARRQEVPGGKGRHVPEGRQSRPVDQGRCPDVFRRVQGQWQVRLPDTTPGLRNDGRKAVVRGPAAPPEHQAMNRATILVVLLV